MGTFLYFGYASNLLAKRIRLQNPTATRKGIAKLKDHRLDFDGESPFWGGASATIVPHAGECVWGAVWEIDEANLADLDRQEGVAQHIYFARTVDVFPGDDEQPLSCRLYERCDRIPVEPPSYPFRVPSATYLRTIVAGALESGLPEEYVRRLRSLPDNGDVNPELVALLGLP